MTLWHAYTIQKYNCCYYVYIPLWSMLGSLPQLLMWNRVVDSILGVFQWRIKHWYEENPFQPLHAWVSGYKNHTWNSKWWSVLQVHTDSSPTLQWNQSLHSVAVLDNCSFHHIAEVVKSINDMGANVLLPPYSSDLNPMEELFSKVKMILRSAEDALGAYGIARWILPDTKTRSNETESTRWT